jgi:mRNA-capping enzyme
MNSVDFYLSAEPGQEPRIAVGGNSANQLIFQEDAKVSMPPGVDPTQYHGFIVECAWDKVMRAWTFMRTRPDKDTPNHLSTFQRVWHSIQDNITEKKLLTAIAAMCEAKQRASEEGVPPPASSQ